MGLFSTPRIEGGELQKCLRYYEASLAVTGFQSREADLFNNTLVKYLNSVAENPVAASEVCKAATRLAQASDEVIRRHDHISGAPDVALRMRCAWSLTFAALKTWAQGTLSAMEALANGMTPEYGHVQRLVGEYQSTWNKALQEERRFLERLKLDGETIERLASKCNETTEGDSWQPDLSSYEQGASV